MTKRPSPLRRLLAGIWRGITWLRLGLANLVFLAMLAFLFFLFRGVPQEPLPERAGLLLNPIGRVVDERRPPEPLTLLAEPSPATAETRLRDMIDAVDAAANDPRITALVIVPQDLLSLGLSRAQELAPALARFRATGKPVIASADYYTQDQYLLAAEADEILLHPYGAVALEGFALYQNYFREALEKLLVDVHVFRAGEFKSVAEPLMRNDMSSGEKAITQAWLTDLWTQYSSHVESRRKLAPGALERQINGYPERLAESGGDPASLALGQGLVDRLLARQEAETRLADVVGATDESGRARLVGFQRYLAAQPASPARGARVAVISAAGNIVPGAGDPWSIGGDALAAELLELARDGDADALVLRINSGGGSVFASEVIRQALHEVRASGIPVVVSMGPVAASGAYFIATAADEIWATPATLTGSIGVFAAFPTVDRLLDRLGVHTDGVATTRLAGALRLDRPLNPDIEAALQQSVDDIYRKFLRLVAEGRDLSVEEVEPLAAGRVWSATDAREVGLVDELGSLFQAIEAAAARLGADHYHADFRGPTLSARERLLQQLAQALPAGLADVLLPEARGFSALQSAMPELEGAYRSLIQYSDPQRRDPGFLYMQCLVCRP
jgi:protease-4